MNNSLKSTEDMPASHEYLRRGCRALNKKGPCKATFLLLFRYINRAYQLQFR